MPLEGGPGAFWEVAADGEEAMARARALAEAHTERTGARGFDLLPIACALALEAEVFLTCDERQRIVAQAERLPVIMVSDQV